MHRVFKKIDVGGLSARDARKLMKELMNGKGIIRAEIRKESIQKIFKLYEPI